MKPKWLHLVPEQGIEIVDGRTFALTSSAWLRIEPIAELVHRKWVRLRYSLSFYDDPVRPLIRFTTNDGNGIIAPMNGPILGSAEWVGRIPDNTTSISISPVARPGRFDFRLDDISAVRRPDLAAKGFRQNPDWMLWAARSRLVNSRREAWQAISFATSGTPMRHYAKWRARLCRPVEPDGLDVPRADWRTGPVFRFLLRLAGDGDAVRLNSTIQSLRRQIYPHWCLSAVGHAGASDALLEAFKNQAKNDARLMQTARNDTLMEKFSGNDFVALIDAGDRLPDYALAALAEVVSLQPELEFIYTDEDSIAAQSHSNHPILKSDWSPVFQRYAGYVGRLAFFRLSRLGHKRLWSLIRNEEITISDVLEPIPRSQIRHVRRVLYSRHSPLPGAPSRSTLQPNAIKAEPIEWPKVTVVIPTQDNVKLLAECLRGLRDKTDYPFVETIIVDNGSSDRAAVRLLDEMATAPHTAVLRRPGPFNFSKLSNDGARAAGGSIVVFLNNDIAVLERNWLKALVRWATEPQIGAVGAKLMFPNGTVQHAGVVLGFGGIAGHVFRRMPQGHQSYLARLAVPHEVSAVTGACIAVAREKFEAVGGFDEDHLPIDLNDIDFCLRLAERGFTNIWTPEATLVHHQSATRGIDSNPFKLYRKERAYFVERWAQVIRDDPFFHPGLSLYAHEVALA